MLKRILLTLTLMASSMTLNAVTPLDALLSKQTQLVQEFTLAKDAISKRSDISPNDKYTLYTLIDKQIKAQDSITQIMQGAASHKTSVDMNALNEQLAYLHRVAHAFKLPSKPQTLNEKLALLKEWGTLRNDLGSQFDAQPLELIPSKQLVTVNKATIANLRRVESSLGIGMNWKQWLKAMAYVHRKPILIGVGTTIAAIGAGAIVQSKRNAWALEEENKKKALADEKECRNIAGDKLVEFATKPVVEARNAVKAMPYATAKDYFDRITKLDREGLLDTLKLDKGIIDDLSVRLAQGFDNQLKALQLTDVPNLSEEDVIQMNNRIKVCEPETIVTPQIRDALEDRAFQIKSFNAAVHGNEDADEDTNPEDTNPADNPQKVADLSQEQVLAAQKHVATLKKANPQHKTLKKEKTLKALEDRVEQAQKAANAKLISDYRAAIEDLNMIMGYYFEIIAVLNDTFTGYNRFKSEYEGILIEVNVVRNKKDDEINESILSKVKSLYKTISEKINYLDDRFCTVDGLMAMSAKTISQEMTEFNKLRSKNDAFKWVPNNSERSKFDAKIAELQSKLSPKYTNQAVTVENKKAITDLIKEIEQATQQLLQQNKEWDDKALNAMKAANDFSAYIKDLTLAQCKALSDAVRQKVYFCEHLTFDLFASNKDKELQKKIFNKLKSKLIDKKRFYALLDQANSIAKLMLLDPEVRVMYVDNMSEIQRARMNNGDKTKAGLLKAVGCEPKKS